MVWCWMWLINIVFLQLPAKKGYPVIRVICHESVIYVFLLIPKSFNYKANKNRHNQEDLQYRFSSISETNRY